MTGSARLLLACRAVAALGAAVGVVALVVPPRTAVGDPLPPPPAPLPVRGGGPAPPDDSMPDLIVSRNPFSPGRRAPRVRAMLEDDAEAGPGGAGDVVADADPGGEWMGGDPAGAARGAAMVDGSDVLADDGGVPALHGVVDGPWGHAALLRLVPSAPGARLYREGEREGGWRVRRILADRVVLDGPWGEVVARLPQTGGRRAAPPAGARPEAP